MGEIISNETLLIAGACALDLIREEADAALKDVDWSKLKNVNLDDLFFEMLKNP